MPARRRALEAVHEPEDVPGASPRTPRVRFVRESRDRTPQQRQPLHVGRSLETLRRRSDDHVEPRQGIRRRPTRCSGSTSRPVTVSSAGSTQRLAAVLEPGDLTSASAGGTHIFCVHAVGPAASPVPRRASPGRCTARSADRGAVGCIHDLRSVLPTLLVARKRRAAAADGLEPVRLRRFSVTAPPGHGARRELAARL